MIKLNNKNITYVALADSNNSLKAPKEIWYADSSNSVKLVYRRKDALIEDEDYEKYHWLTKELTNTDNEATYGNKAVIDTLVNFTDDLVIEAILNNADRVDNRGFGITTGQDNSVYVAFLSNNNRYFAAVCNNRIIYSQDNQINIAFSLSDITINGVTTSYSQETLTYNPSIAIGGVKSYTGVFYYKVSNTQLNTSGIAKYGNFIFRKGNSVIMRLIPCKLLKPVPKWLDANGIRRQVGECGMIDLVSGKFYGNVNSVGTFTVENYYERKEWLVGDGSAYIDTLHSASEDLDWVTKVGNLTDGKALFWDRDGNGYAANMNVMIARTNDYRIGVRIANNSSEILLNPFPSSFTVQTNGEAITIDGQSYSVIKNAGFNRNIKLFQTLPFADTNGVKCAYFRFLDSNGNYIQNLIPCTLTMDLPASMDANNIARTKGTSGMWDLVSDRFYGNVANSGTFKAVNLAEGVDYEVHDWLVGEIPIQTSMQALPINSTNFRFTAIFGQKANITILKGETHEYYVFDDNMQKIRVWGYNGIGNVYAGDVLSNTMIVESTSAELLVNNITIPQYSYPIKYLTFYSSSDSPNNTTLRVSKIYVDGVERYIPVKLLKSIPAKYDANGRARQAGECGMYDTLNDVFYGNVASSGTFSVSDDS